MDSCDIFASEAITGEAIPEDAITNDAIPEQEYDPDLQDSQDIA